MEASIVWPLVSNRIRRGATSNTFGMVRHRADGTPKPHQGWDFAAEVGTPFYAIADGRIHFIREHGDYGLQLCYGFEYGGKTYYAFYAHLSKTYAAHGDKLDIPVSANDELGKTGESGNAKGMGLADQHLHFEIRTSLTPRLGLHDRVSPGVVFGKCPLHAAIPG